jgi:uncharacterized protein YggE
MKLMKSIVRIATTFVLFAAASVFAQDACPHPRLISVTGTAELNVAPDQVIVTIDVQGRDRDLDAAKAQHDRRVKKIIAEARNAGVESKYIQTSSIQMNPAYSEEKVPRFLAYEITQTIRVTLKDLSKYESLLTKLIENGVNRIDGVEFQVDDSRKYKDETRLKAIRAAKEKATAMAAELGQTISKPWEINEEAESGSYMYANTRVMAGAGGGAPNEPTVAPGQVTIRSSVRSASSWIDKSAGCPMFRAFCETWGFSSGVNLTLRREPCRAAPNLFA